MADWLKPRQHICVALATVCWTGADHWIQMWKSFGVPISDFMNATPFFPPSEFLNSDTMKFIWRNPTHRPCTQFKRHQVVETLRVVTPIWSKTSGQMWWGHFHELLILLGKHLFARIHIWMRFKEKKNADDLLNPRQHNTCSSEKTTHFMENRNQKMLSDDPPPPYKNEWSTQTRLPEDLFWLDTKRFQPLLWWRIWTCGHVVLGAACFPIGIGSRYGEWSLCQGYFPES